VCRIAKLRPAPRLGTSLEVSVHMRVAHAAAGLVVLIVAPSTQEPERGDTSAETIAMVLREFVHAATPQQQESLQRIVDDRATSDADRTLARALLRVLHVPHPDDAPALQTLMKDSRLPRLERTLARVIANLIHVPNSAQKDAICSELLRDQRDTLP
jgi:hypothetical protein